MYEVKWRRQALQNMDHIADFIALDNRERAVSFVHDIFSLVEELRIFPYRGKAGKRADIRELVVHQHYLVLYRVGKESIEVLQVWHAAQER